MKAPLHTGRAPCFGSGSAGVWNLSDLATCFFLRHLNALSTVDLTGDGPWLDLVIDVQCRRLAGLEQAACFADDRCISENKKYITLMVETISRRPWQYTIAWCTASIKFRCKFVRHIEFSKKLLTFDCYCHRFLRPSAILNLKIWILVKSFLSKSLSDSLYQTSS